MSYITISKPLSVDHLHRLKRRWQRGLAVEYSRRPFLMSNFLGRSGCRSTVARCRYSLLRHP